MRAGGDRPHFATKQLTRTDRRRLWVVVLAFLAIFWLPVLTDGIRRGIPASTPPYGQTPGPATVTFAGTTYRPAGEEAAYARMTFVGTSREGHRIFAPDRTGGGGGPSVGVPLYLETAEGRYVPLRSTRGRR